jgi:arginyl-tRNA synthetase
MRVQVPSDASKASCLLMTNLFDYLEEAPSKTGSPAPWSAWAPRRPTVRFDLKLVPRSAAWQKNAESLQALEEIERQPWVSDVSRRSSDVSLRLDDDWIEASGAAVEAGDSEDEMLADLVPGQSYSVQFWDANATKALHVGHLRNLAIGNAIAAALAQAGAHVERRSLISDVGRSMGEAMAGVRASRGHMLSLPAAGEKSDHFVGACYADYVASVGSFTGTEIEHPEDSMTRELTPRDDAADELVRCFLRGEPEALELWSKTRAWVIAGQRKTLARLGIAFDRVFFESDFLADVAALTTSGLRDGTLKRRADDVVVYVTGVEDFEEFPLVRADGLPTQHMRALVYWMAAPELDGTTSMQVCGTEWVSHVTCRRKLMKELMGPGNGAMHPTRDIFNGMVSRQKRAVASSEGALLIDDLAEWLDAQIDADPSRREVRRRNPSPEHLAAQVALGYFLPHPVAPSVDFDPEQLLRQDESLGWDLACARAHCSQGESNAGLAHDPAYRFAVVQSQLYRRYLRLAAQRLDVAPLARYLKHLARWYVERDRGEHVGRVVHALLSRSARGLGLEAAP